MMKKPLKQEKKSRTVSRQGFKRSPKLSSLLNSRTVDNNILIFKNTGVKEGKPRKGGQGKKFRKNISEKSFFSRASQGGAESPPSRNKMFSFNGLFLCRQFYFTNKALYAREKNAFLILLLRLPRIAILFGCNNLQARERGGGGTGVWHFETF